MSESTGEWAEQIGSDLERLRARMDLSISPGQFSFGNKYGFGVPRISAGPGHLHVHGPIADERGNLTNVIGSTYSAGWPPARNGGWPPREWGGASLELTTERTPANERVSPTSSSFHLSSTSRWSGEQFPAFTNTSRYVPGYGGGKHTERSYEVIPSEEMFDELEKFNEEHPPSREQITANVEHMAATSQRQRNLQKKHGLDREEIVTYVDSSRPRVGVSLPLPARPRLSAFHLGTGGFRFLEEGT